jgi:hypothetical protein
MIGARVKRKGFVDFFGKTSPATVRLLCEKLVYRVAGRAYLVTESLNSGKPAFEAKVGL